MKKIIFLFLFILIPSIALADQSNKKFAVITDVGIPDGINAGLAFIPTKWLNVNIAASHNLMSMGTRAGITFDPLHSFISPTISIEMGGFWKGKMHFIENMPEISYLYTNFHLGLDIGNKSYWKFFIHTGSSYIYSNIYSINNLLKIDNSLTISNVTISGFLLPSAKIGFNILF